MALSSKRVPLIPIFYSVKNQSSAPLFLLSAKSHARLSCSLINALTTLSFRYQLFAICIIVPKCVTGTFGEERYPFSYSLRGTFLREKSSPNPSKDRFAKSVTLSADSGSGLCPESLPPFVKGGRKLLVLLPKAFRSIPPFHYFAYCCYISKGGI